MSEVGLRIFCHSRQRAALLAQISKYSVLFNSSSGFVGNHRQTVVLVNTVKVMLHAASTFSRVVDDTHVCETVFFL